jgi:hypothetical protein
MIDTGLGRIELVANAGNGNQRIGNSREIENDA